MSHYARLDFHNLGRSQGSIEMNFLPLSSLTIQATTLRDNRGALSSWCAKDVGRVAGYALSNLGSGGESVQDQGLCVDERPPLVARGKLCVVPG